MKYLFIFLGPNHKTLVFVQTKRCCEYLHYFLEENRVSCEAIHGDRSQNQRQTALRAFKSGLVPVLIATSVSKLMIQSFTYINIYSPFFQIKINQNFLRYCFSNDARGGNTKYL